MQQIGQEPALSNCGVYRVFLGTPFTAKANKNLMPHRTSSQHSKAAALLLRLIVTSTYIRCSRLVFQKAHCCNVMIIRQQVLASSVLWDTFKRNRHWQIRPPQTGSSLVCNTDKVCFMLASFLWAPPQILSPCSLIRWSLQLKPGFVPRLAPTWMEAYHLGKASLKENPKIR